VQRLFSMFPTGRPGIALLLLRTSVATAVLLDGYVHRHELSSWALAAMALISVSLGLGFLTPIIALIALVCHVFAWTSMSFDCTGLTAVEILNALALALLGPGAYSIDAFRFGRHVVVLPPRD
jgi:hypothetical protein